MKEVEPWSRAETWVRRHLLATGLRWTRPRPSRFWNRRLGIAVDLIGEGGPSADFDERAASEDGVIVVQVREFSDGDAAEAVKAMRFAEPWNARRRALGLWRIEGAD